MTAALALIALAALAALALGLVARGGRTRTSSNGRWAGAARLDLVTSAGPAKSAPTFTFSARPASHGLGAPVYYIWPTARSPT